MNANKLYDQKYELGHSKGEAAVNLVIGKKIKFVILEPIDRKI